MTKLFINLTSGRESADRATVAFVVANAGLAAGQEVVIFLNIEAVRLVLPGYADEIAVAGFKPLKELLASYIENGGKIWICPPCFNGRGLDKALVPPTAIFAGGAAVVEFLAQGAASLSY